MTKSGNLTAVVYGGSGFVGNYVVDALCEAGLKVRIFDTSKPEHLGEFQEMIVGDIADHDAVVKAAEGADYVYNFAALADINEAINKPIETAKVNILGNINVLEAARINKAKRFVLASSVYVYSRHGSFYRVSKQCSEQYTELYSAQYGLDYTILRYGTLYGRKADKRNSVYRLVSQALEQNKITYVGDPNEMREYIHIKDAARLSVDILDPKYINRALVLTGSERMAVRNLISLIAEMCPKPVTVEFKESSPTAGHYIVSPYSFNPKLGNKLTLTDYVDIGQGILDCMTEQFDKLSPKEQGNE